MLYMAWSNEDTVLGQKLWNDFKESMRLYLITAVLFLGIWLASLGYRERWAWNQISGRQKKKQTTLNPFSSRLWPPKRQTGWSSVSTTPAFKSLEGLFIYGRLVNSGGLSLGSCPESSVWVHAHRSKNLYWTEPRGWQGCVPRNWPQASQPEPSRTQN